MSADSFTEVTSQSWFSRIGGAIKGVLVGIVLFLVAFPLLFWNEGRAVKRYKTLKEGAGAVVSVDSGSVDAARDGALVHLTGEAITQDTVSDPVFGMSATALQLRRKVEMYQWKESEKSSTRKKVGGGTETTKTYTYDKTWSEHPINSGNFKKPEGHGNPGAMPYSTKSWMAGKVTLGAFTLSRSLVGRIRTYADLPVPSDTPLPAELGSTAIRHNSGFYVGGSPASPQVGDLRVSFAVVNPTGVSIVARQARDSFEPYATKAGGTIELLETGVHAADAMFAAAQKSNRTLTWILRLVGFVVMMVGLNLVFRPLSVVADVIPFIGSIVGAGTGLIALLIAGALSTVTIAIAWIVFRPLLGIALLVVAVGLIVLVVKKTKKPTA